MAHNAGMRFKIITATFVAGFLMAGCGDQTGGTESPPAAERPATSSAPSSPAASSAPPSAGAADELKVAVQAYSDAFLTGNATKAYELLSARCRKRRSLSEFTGIVTAAGQLYGSALPLETYSAKVAEDLARVTYTYSIKAINQEAEPWTREGGSWHQDDC
jgi:hypothetical protein